MRLGEGFCWVCECSDTTQINQSLPAVWEAPLCVCNELLPGPKHQCTYYSVSVCMLVSCVQQAQQQAWLEGMLAAGIHGGKCFICGAASSCCQGCILHVDIKHASICLISLHVDTGPLPAQLHTRVCAGPAESVCTRGCVSVGVFAAVLVGPFSQPP